MNFINEKDKVWLITGITGMDGSIFADLLLTKGYINIHGLIRRSSTFNTSNIEHIFSKLKLHYSDLTDAMNIYQIIQKIKPDYIVNFAAMSHVKVSHEMENYTFQANTLGVLNILQSVKSLGLVNCKIYQANTSETFGNTTDGTKLLNEESEQKPCSIYAISKKASQDICNLYRDAYGMFIVSSILFNHEGPRRGHTFVTQKIVDYVAVVNLNMSIGIPIVPLQLGNLNAKRDWGLANKYMEAVYLMMRQEKPDTFVIATGESHSVREFVELAFNVIGINIKWEGEGINEIGLDSDTDGVLIEVNSKYYRDIDIDCLIGDASKAKRILGWEYDVSFKNLVEIMVDNAIQNVKLPMI
jgi:GDPmannose 4,6-dehydratase